MDTVSITVLVIFGLIIVGFAALFIWVGCQVKEILDNENLLVVDAPKDINF